MNERQIIYYDGYIRSLQEQAAKLSRLARDYSELGPSWRFQTITMQTLAAKHYDMARNALHYRMTGDPGVIVGKRAR